MGSSKVRRELVQGVASARGIPEEDLLSTGECLLRGSETADSTHRSGIMKSVSSAFFLRMHGIAEL